MSFCPEWNNSNFDTITYLLNTAWQITEVSNSAKRKVEIPKIFGKCTGRHELCLHTISHFRVLYGFFVNTYGRCCKSDFIQLFNLIFHIRELKKHHDRGDGAGFFIYRRHYSLLFVERLERLKSFQNWWEVLQRYLPLATFFMQSSYSSRTHFTWENLLARCLSGQI